MAIIVEDGSGVVGANSYASLADCDSYFESKGYTTWVDGDDDQKEYAIINSCQHMEIYPWKGQKALSTYELVWPRRSVHDRDGYTVLSTEIPRDVIRGQMELAFRLYAGKSPFVDVASGDGFIIKEVVGPVEVSYAQGYSTSYKFPEVDRLFEPYLDSSLNVLLERA